jgi:hypothetical protein
MAVRLFIHSNTIRIMEETKIEIDKITGEVHLDVRIKVKKAKLSKGGCVEASYTDQDGNEISIKGKNKCHMDLRVALEKLVPYFADITEQKEADLIDWSDLDSAENVTLLKKIEVTGVAIGGDDTNQIITMTGKRTLFTARILNLNSPGIELDSETFDWAHTDDFDIAVQEFFYEVEQYIVNRKWEVVQPTLDFGDNPDDPFAEPEATNPAPNIEEPAESVA